MPCTPTSPFEEIRRTAELSTRMRPAVSTVYDWVARFRGTRSPDGEACEPRLGDTWNMACEIAMAIGRRRYWLLDLIDPRTRFVVAVLLSRTRTERDARRLLERACRGTRALPRHIVAKGRWKTSVTSLQLDVGTGAKHIPVSFSVPDGADRAWHDMLLSKNVRMPKVNTLRRAMGLLEVRQSAYNRLGAQAALGDRTPAEAAGIERPKISYKQAIDVLYAQAAKRARREHTRQIIVGQAPRRSGRQTWLAFQQR